MQPPPEHDVSHAPSPHRNVQPPPEQSALHDEPSAHSTVQPPPEHEKPHEAPALHTNAHPAREHVPVHDVPPLHVREHGLAAVDGQPASHGSSGDEHTRCSPEGPLSGPAPPASRDEASVLSDGVDQS